MPKVLLIEDEESLRNLYTRILSNKNYEVESAADGEIALSLLKYLRTTVSLRAYPSLCSLRFPKCAG
jgi:DNA-binding response OmpR family regulator